ncbi:uncharacterized protein EDB93DRAFT_1234381 [Suillus bovinus]|uniref:uncharacterized protein n=2 Tax=Suillus bovinus TaxID=48563 RepID=UPI001B876B9D|nr:uncharacterized protein EDB93DRAFT_1234381 [Suillus bovinus]KAG2129702.1 hypothetical protein EDB93DRAFT_1234381 [Suillus bovinus]
MSFGEVVHYVTQPTGWPEQVRAIASLLPPFHCPDRPSNEHFASPSSSTFSEPLPCHEPPAPGSYTAKDFQFLIESTAAGLNALAELPHYGGQRSTVPIWSQLIHALANTLSSDVLILEDAPFIMPRAQNAASQPSNLIDGHATLLAAHAIFSEPRTYSDVSMTSSLNEQDGDESIYSADCDSCDDDDSVESLDLPLQAHMLPGRGRRLSAVIPVLLVADSSNIVPLLCSALYQRRVWGICQPVVGLCCSSTGTIVMAIFGWLDQSEEGRMASFKLMHIFPSDVLSDPSMGVFDFTDTCSATSLAQFVLGLRTHFQDIKGATSIEAVDSLTALGWRSDLPDFETQFGARLDERVTSWTHQVHVQTSSRYRFLSLMPSPDIYGRGSRPSSSRNSSKRTSPSPQPLSQGMGSTSSRAPSAYSNSQFAALSDNGLVDGVSMSNWLFERHAFTVGRIPIRSEELASETRINAMVKIYDQMTGFTWSNDIKTIVGLQTFDSCVSDIRSELLDTNGGPDRQPSAIDAPSLKDVEFIARRISMLLHAVNGARSCDDVAQLHGANEADRRHEWESLLLNFFQPVPKQRDVLLERQSNLTRNLVADDPSFETRAIDVINRYQEFCLEQDWRARTAAEASGSWRQTAAVRDQANKFLDDFMERNERKGFATFAETIAHHSSKDPATGKCDTVLVIPCSNVATAMLKRISSIDEQETLLKSFMLVQGPKPGTLDTSTGETLHQIEKSGSRKTTSNKSLQVPSSSRVSESNKIDRAQLHNPFLHHPDRNQTTQRQEAILSNDAFCDEPSGQDLLLPVLLVEYKKRDESAISTAMNQTKTYLVSAVTFLSEFSITDQPVFGLVVNGALGAITMAWKTNNVLVQQIYIMEHNVRHYDIRDPLQALQFVSILPRLARHGLGLRHILEKQLTEIDMTRFQSKLWSKLPQRLEDKRLAAAKRTESQSEQAAAQDGR